ncbi:MAG: hypothetical protein ACFFG0_40385 [Candidatus Thorarchaeota archaeon]
MVTINHDITEYKKTENKFREAYEHANLYKDIFTHDFNNILQNIQSSLELISMYLIIPEKSNTIKDIRKDNIFQRVSKEKSSNGVMGLRLSLVKKVIDRYNRKIWVEEKINRDYSKGSKFKVLIPEVISSKPSYSI